MTGKGTGRKVKISVTIDKNIIDRIDKERLDTGVSRSYKIESYVKKGMAIKELEVQVKAIREEISFIKIKKNKKN